MKILLDENFPLQLYRRLRAAGRDVEHIIALGQRGLPDSAIQARLQKEALLFLTQDSEFADMPLDCAATIVISQVRQSRPIHERVEIWLRAIEEIVAGRAAEQLFDLLDSGELIPWQVTTNC